MKKTIYIRVGRKTGGRGKPAITGGAKPSLIPLTDSFGPIPTVAFAVTLDIPDAMFGQAERVLAEITVREDSAQIAADVKQIGAPDA